MCGDEQPMGRRKQPKGTGEFTTQKTPSVVLWDIPYNMGSHVDSSDVTIREQGETQSS
jgi:hypothetical protein